MEGGEVLSSRVGRKKWGTWDGGSASKHFYFFIDGREGGTEEGREIRCREASSL